MIVELKNGELVDFYDAMKQISETEKNNRAFTYAVTLNEENLKSNVAAILNCAKPANEYRAYESERESLIKKYAEKDENNNLVVDRTTQLIKIKKEFREEARIAFNQLDEDNKEILAGRQKDLQDYYKLLNKFVAVDIEQVELENFPEYINKIMMRALKPLIKTEE